MRRFVPLLHATLLLFASVQSTAQVAHVSATVTDPNGQVFGNGSWKADIIPPPNTSTTILNLDGLPFPHNFSGSLSSGGAFTQDFPANDHILPKGSKWQIQICGYAGNNCFVFQTPLVTGSTDLSGALSGVSVVIKTAMTEDIPNTADHVQLTIIEGSNQTAETFEVRDPIGNILCSIEPDGTLFGACSTGGGPPSTGCTATSVGQSQFCGGPIAPDGPLSVQFFQGKSTTSPTPTLTLDAPVTSGHALVVIAACLSFPALGCGTASGGGSGIVSDSLGNSFTFQGVVTSGYYGANVWTAPITHAGVDNVSFDGNFNPVALNSDATYTFVGEFGGNIGALDVASSVGVSTDSPGTPSGSITATQTTAHNNMTVISLGIQNTIVVPDIFLSGSPYWRPFGSSISGNSQNEWVPAMTYIPVSGTTYSIKHGVNGFAGCLNCAVGILAMAFNPSSWPPSITGPPSFRDLNYSDAPLGNFFPIIQPGVPLGACYNGSIYSDQQNGGTYVCEDFGWKKILSSLVPASLSSAGTCNGASEGKTAVVTDSDINTWGDIVVHTTGTNRVLAYCNGVNWTVMAK